MMDGKIAVIGSGFGGLAAAIRLAAMGYSVHLFEKQGQLGGRAAQFEMKGFRFDGGPTVITAPHMLEELFHLAGSHLADHIDLVPVNPFYRIFDSNGRHFDYHQSPDDLLQEVERWNAADKNGFQRFSAHIRAIFKAMLEYTESSMAGWPDHLSLRKLFVLASASLLSVYSLAALYIKDPFLRNVFSFHPLLIGGNPFETPALMAMIAQFEREWGVYYSRGGTGSIVQALGTLFQQMGGQIHLNCQVDQIMFQGRSAVGVRLHSGENFQANIVVCNADLPYSYTSLIPAALVSNRVAENIKRKQYSSSLFVLYFGTNRQYSNAPLLHHNLIFSEHYRENLNEVFKGEAIPDDFTVYLHMPTRTDPTLAPPGCDSFYALVLVPNLAQPFDWNHLAPHFAERILLFLEERFLPDLRSHLEVVHHIDPRYFHDTLNSYYGAAFSLRPSLFQIGWFRPQAQSKDFENLYFVGAGAHPGAGVPAVLASAKIAARLICAPKAQRVGLLRRRMRLIPDSSRN